MPVKYVGRHPFQEKLGILLNRSARWLFSDLERCSPCIVKCTCESKPMTFEKRQKHGHRRMISGCPGLGDREGCAGGALRNFRAVQPLCVQLSWRTQTRICQNPRDVQDEA